MIEQRKTSAIANPDQGNKVVKDLITETIGPKSSAVETSNETGTQEAVEIQMTPEQKERKEMAIKETEKLFAKISRITQEQYDRMSEVQKARVMLIVSILSALVVVLAINLIVPVFGKSDVVSDANDAVMQTKEGVREVWAGMLATVSAISTFASGSMYFSKRKEIKEAKEQAVGNTKEQGQI